MRTSHDFSCRDALPILIASGLIAASFMGYSGDLPAQDRPRVSEVCLNCHGGMDTTLAVTAHRLSEALDAPEATVACTDCHPGDSRHWEEAPGEYAMTNPSKVGALSEARLCSTCHQNAHQQNMLEKNVHTMNDVSCSGCHSVHGSAHPALLRKAESRLCLDCHRDVEGQFAKPFRHPVKDKIVKCSECHMTLDLTRRELSHNGTNACTQCHSEFEGPFPYEHQATVDYSTQEGGCLSCHEPHGSYRPRMLRQPYEAPHFQLCSQCHSVPRHNSNSNHGTAFAGVACNECHTDIHGSYTSRNFLSEALRDEGCLTAGCHQ